MSRDQNLISGDEQDSLAQLLACLLCPNVWKLQKPGVGRPLLGLAIIAQQKDLQSFFTTIFLPDSFHPTIFLALLFLQYFFFAKIVVWPVNSSKQLFFVGKLRNFVWPKSSWQKIRRRRVSYQICWVYFFFS